MSIEQMCRDLLTQAMKDRLVSRPREYSWADTDPQARSSGDLTGMANLLGQLLAAAVAAEREACARVAEDLSPADPADNRYRGGREACGRVAAAIRARADQ